MRALVRYITRKSRGGIAVRDEIAEGDVVIAGRGPDCGIRLPDPRVLLRHAEFQIRSGDLYVSAGQGADLRVNDNLTQTAKLEQGDKVRIGPYEVEVQEKAEGTDITVGVELLEALGNDLQKLAARSKIQ